MALAKFFSKNNATLISITANRKGKIQLIIPELPASAYSLSLNISM